jgi:predicted MPP superfamily phosphohydrolase
MLSRRTFLRIAGSAAAAGIGTGLYTWQVEPEWLDIVHRDMSVHDLPDALRNARLVHLSDIHAGPHVDDRYLADVFARVRAFAPDLVAYTGDFVTLHANLDRHAESVYRDLPRGRLGTVAVLGNHDYGYNWSEPDAAARLARMLGAHGVTVLENATAEVAGLQFVGMGDLWANRLDVARALATRDVHRPAIVLSHNPDSVDGPGWDGYHGWILGGHTHGGQCKPPFLPPPILPVRNKRYTSGAFALHGDRQLYISRGVGTVLPVRFNVRPEVTIFTLRRA